MNLTALVWLGAFIILAGLTFRRASWGIPLYMLTYWAFPGLWWWGQGPLTSLGIRWNLAASLIFVAGVLLDGRTRSPGTAKSTRPACLLLLLYILNATVVHFLFADNPENSWRGLELLWKQGALVLFLLAAIKDRFDLKLMIYAILVGAAYIGYEVVFNGEGNYVDGRLEGVSIPSVGEANALASLLTLAILLGGHLLLCGTRVEKCFAVLSLVLTLEVILRCNSRSVTLALIFGGAWLLVGSRGKLRRYALAGAVLAVVAAFLQMGETQQARNLARFQSTFASADQRDGSAQSRLNRWVVGLKMVGDYPLGSGYEAAFRSDLGMSYWENRERPGNLEDDSDKYYHTVHMGYLNIAASWGIQGLLLYLGAIFFAWRGVRRSVSQAYSSGDSKDAFLGCCLDAALLTLLVACTFASNLKAEWFFWWIALALVFERIVQTPALTSFAEGEVDSQAECEWEEEPAIEIATR